MSHYGVLDYVLSAAESGNHTVQPCSTFI